MNSIFPWLGIAVLILCGWAIVKKYQVNMVLLLGGLILNLLAFWGGAEIFPKKFSATGIVGFDLIELLRTISVSQVSGVGFLMAVLQPTCRQSAPPTASSPSALNRFR